MKTIQQLVSSPDFTASVCGWCEIGNKRPSMARAGTGLSRTMCRPHKDHLDRHGHPSKPSYSEPEFAPYLALAERWVAAIAKRRRSTMGLAIPGRAKTDLDFAAKAALSLLSEGIDDDRDYPRRASEKARAIAARLKRKYCGEVTDRVRHRWPKRHTPEELARKVLAWTIGMELVAACDPSPGTTRYEDMQLGKLLFRRAGGWSRKYWSEPSAATFLSEVREVNYYPKSRGPGVRTVGKNFRQAAELLWDAHGAALTAHAREHVPDETIANWTAARLQRPIMKGRGGKRKPPRPGRNPWGPHDRIRHLKRNPAFAEY